MPSDCRLGLDFSELAIRACGIFRCLLRTPLEGGRRRIEHKCAFRIPEDNSTPPRRFGRSSATELLQVGVDSSVISLWLWHKSVAGTQTYLHVHLALRETALAKMTLPNSKLARYRPADELPSGL
jgi:integrase/recombinase XerD